MHFMDFFKLNSSVAMNEYTFALKLNTARHSKIVKDFERIIIIIIF